MLGNVEYGYRKGKLCIFGEPIIDGTDMPHGGIRAVAGVILQKRNDK